MNELYTRQGQNMYFDPSAKIPSKRQLRKDGINPEDTTDTELIKLAVSKLGLDGETLRRWSLDRVKASWQESLDRIDGRRQRDSKMFYRDRVARIAYWTVWRWWDDVLAFTESDPREFVGCDVESIRQFRKYIGEAEQ